MLAMDGLEELQAVDACIRRSLITTPGRATASAPSAASPLSAVRT
jgi:hypothetical protein